jgi:hypothetical protein
MVMPGCHISETIKQTLITFYIGGVHLELLSEFNSDSYWTNKTSLQEV